MEHLKTTDFLKIENELEKILKIKLTNNNSLEQISEKVKSKIFAHFNSENSAEILDCNGVSSGYSYGELITISDFKKNQNNHNNNIILISTNGSLNDIQYIKNAQGFIILNGTTGSHAAIVARSLQIPTVIITDPIISNEILSKSINREFCSIDGTYGKLYFGKAIPFIPDSKLIYELIKWNDKYEQVLYKKMKNNIKIMVNADNEYEVSTALTMGATGIGSCRIEHMFLDDSRIPIIQGLLLLPENNSLFKKFCNEFEHIIENDVTNMLSIIKDKPYTIRLLDALPSEFLPEIYEEIDQVAQKIGISNQEYIKYYSLIRKNSDLDNMRGCRLGMMKEEIYTAQIFAIIKSIKTLLENGENVDIRVIIPYINNSIEAEKWTKYLYSKIGQIKKEYNNKLSFKSGIMIETPRAALIANKLAQQCEIFTYGTNDLTQYTYSISRSTSMKKYNEICNLDKIFQNIDREGVGQLIENSIKISKNSNKKLIIGICGEHVNHISSLEYFKNLDIDYVSCIPSNVLYIRTLFKIMFLKDMKNRGV